MKKLITLIAGVSIAALIAGVSFADEENVIEKPVGEEIQTEEEKVTEKLIDEERQAANDDGTSAQEGDEGEGDDIKPQKNFNSAKSNTSTKVSTDGDDGDDPDSALKDCRQCKLKKSYPLEEVKTDDDGDEAKSPDLTQVRTVKEGDTPPKAGTDEESKVKKDKKDDDG